MKNTINSLLILAFSLFSLGLHPTLLPQLRAAESTKKARLAALFVYPDSYASKRGRDIVFKTIDELNSIEDLHYVGTDSKLFLPPVLGSENSFADQRKRLDDARKLFAELDLEESLEILASVKDAVEKDLSLFGNLSILAETMLYKAAAHQLLGDEPAAREAFVLFLSLDEEEKIDEKEFPPDTIKFFKEVKDEVDLMPNGSLFFGNYPDNSEVFVDGRFAGVTPLRIDGLIAGRHYYVIKKLGYKPLAGAVDVRDKGEHEETRALEMFENARFLDESSGRLATEFGSVPMLKESVVTARKLGVKRLLVFTGKQKKKSFSFGGIAVDADKESYREEWVDEGGDVNALVSKLLENPGEYASIASLEKLLAVKDAEIKAPAATKKPIKKKKKEEESSILSAWWFWTVVGVGVAGAGVGTYFIIDGQKGGSDSATLEINF